MTEKTLLFTAVCRKVEGTVVFFFFLNHYLLSRKNISFIFKMWFSEVNNVRQDAAAKEKQCTPTILRVFLADLI